MKTLIIYILSPNWKNESAYIRKPSPRNVALVGNKLRVLVLLVQLENQVLKGEYKCFAIYDIALNEGRLAIVNNKLRFEIGQTIEALARGGYPTLWERQLKHFHKLKSSRWQSLKEASPYISINTLSPFFNTMGITIIAFAVIYLLEIVSRQL
ncbi:hypothetical protein Fcan01_23764 [Folsomia candida]|uniref:Uncharacterized protein n=1 Tax=Folsomia candida TaxID=158441 RepID=A0A226D8W4_FOLCA|nr:hypothetical protein Fcan01_23764 [Folsomia candida]